MPPQLDTAPPGSPPGGAAPQAAGAGTTSPGQPPFGASPLTMPTPNRGSQATAMAAVRNVVDMLSHVLVQLGPGGAGTELGQAVLKAMQSLGKHVPPGQTSPGAQNTEMEKFMMERRQQPPPLLAALQAMKGGGAPSGASGTPPVSPPLPGAG